MASNPFILSPGSSTGGSSSNPFDLTPAVPKGLSASQALQMYIASQHHGHSFLHDVIHGGGSALAWGMQQLLRPATAVAEGTRAGLEGKGFDLGDALHGARQGFMLDKHTTFSDVLKQEFPQWSRHHTVQRALAGFGLDVVTDPTLPLQIGADVATGGALTPELVAGRLAVEEAARGAAMTEARHAALKTASDAFRAAGPGFSAHKAYADALLRMASSDGLNDAGRMAVDHAANMYKQEVGRNFTKALQLQYKIPFSSKMLKAPVEIGGVRIAPKAASLARTAQGAGIIGHVPGMKQLASGAGQLFKPAFQDPEWMTAVRLAENHAALQKDTYIGHLAATLGQTVAKHGMTIDDQEKALIWADKHASLLTPDRKINEQTLQHGLDTGGLSAGQGEYLRNYHNYTEFLRAQDKQFGIKYKKEIGQGLYHPIIKSHPGGQFIAAKGGTALPGYIEPKVAHGLDAAALREIRLNQQAGKYTRGDWRAHLETDPIKRLALRAQKGATAHSRESLLDSVASTFGTAVRIPDMARADKQLAKLTAAKAVLKKHSWVYDPAARRKVWAAQNKAIKIKYDAQRAAAETTYKEKKFAFETGADPVKLAKETARHNKAVARLKRTVKNPDTFRTRLDAEIARHGHAVTKLQSEERALARPPGYHLTLAEQHIRALDNIAKREAKAHAQKELDRIQMQTVAHEASQAAAKRIANLERVMARVPMKRNPAFNPDTMREMSRKIGPTTYGFDHDLHAAMTRVEHIIRDSDNAQEHLATGMNKYMSAWKQIVTTINPGYHVRNTMSDMWNAYINGMPAWAMGKYGARAAKMYKLAMSAHNKIMEAGDRGLVHLTPEEKHAMLRFTEAYHNSIFAGLVQGDIQAVHELVVHGRGPINMLKQKRGIKAYNAMWIDFNRSRENVGRFTHYLYRREGQHLSAYDAALHVKQAHFDYQALTPFERDKLKKIIPFYTWTRKNIPYQLDRMVHAPGRYATYPKAMNLGAELALGDHNKEVPNPGIMSPFLMNQLAAVVPGGQGLRMLIPQFGPSDLVKVPGLSGSITSAISQDASLLAPWFKAPVEIATNTNSFTQQPISDQGRLKPIGGPLAGPVASILGAVGLAGTTSRGGVHEQGINPWAAYFAQQAGGPLAATALFQQAPTAQSARGDIHGVGLGLVSYISGVSLYDRNPQLEATVAQLNFQDQVKKTIRNLRDAGTLPPAPKHKPSKFQNNLMATLAGGGK